MNDLIIGAIKDRGIKDIDCYVTSIARSGFNGRGVMLCENVSNDVRSFLQARGFELCDVATRTDLHFQTARIIPALGYLREHRNELRYVIWTDVCDLVFQTEPIEALERVLKGKSLIAIKEGWLIKNQPINDYWLTLLGLSDEERSWLREQEVLCSGTIAGTIDAMITLFETMIAWFDRAGATQGIDQGVFNRVMRLSHIQEISRVPEPEEAFITTVGIFLAPSDPNVWTISPPIFSGGVVHTPGGEPFAIQHQFNRAYGVFDKAGTWRHQVEALYR